MDIGAIKARMELDAKQFKTAMEQAKEDTKELADRVNKLGDSLDNLGSRANEVGKVMSVGLTAPLAAISAAATKVAIDFESSFANVRKTVDATGEEFARLEKGIRQMALEIPVAATEIANVAGAAGQLGIQTDAILGFTRVMTDLSVASDLTSESAAMALARFATITDMSQDQFDRLGSTVVHLGNNLAAMESEIVEMGLRIAGAGATIGMTEDQILAFAGSLAAVGISAEAGGTAFSKLMITIANDVATGAESVEDFAKVAGMSVEEFTKTFREDAASAIVAFIEGLGRINDAGGNTFKIIEDLGLSEIRLRDALLRSAGAGDVMRNSLELANTAWEENNALTNEAAERYGTSASQLQLFKNRLTEIGIEFGSVLAPALIAALDATEPLLDALQRLVEWFSELDEGTQRLVLVIGALVAAAGPALMLFGGMASGAATLARVIPTVVSAVRTLTTSQLALNAAMRANPIGLVVTALGALGLAVYEVDRQMKQLKQEKDENRRKSIELANEYDELDRKLRTLDADTEEARTTKARMAEIMSELTRISPGVVDAYNAQTGALRSMANASIQAMEAQLNLLRAQEVALSSRREVNPIKHWKKNKELYSVRAEIHELEKLLGGARINKSIEDDLKKLAYYDAANAWRSAGGTSTSPSGLADFSTGGGSGGSAGKSSGSSRIPTAREIDPIEELRTQFEAEKRLTELRYAHANAVYNDERNLLAKHIETLEALQTKHSEYLAANEEERLRFATEIANKKRQLDHANFEFSETWIRQEERRMRERGESDIAILEMQVEAWERVRARYLENTAEYMRADEALYQARIRLAQEAQKAEEELTRERERQVTELTRTIRPKLDRLERAELDSIDRRKREIERYYEAQKRAITEAEREELASISRRRDELQRFYDEQIGVIDEEQRADEKKEILAEIEKFRYATSKQGRETLKRLEDRLRRIEDEERKRALQKERDERLRNLNDQSEDLRKYYGDKKTQLDDDKRRELEALDEQRNAIRSYYADLKNAVSNFSGDVREIERLMQDSRLRMFSETNDAILREMRSFVSEYDRIQSRTSSGSSGGSMSPQPSIPTTPSKPSNPLGMSDIDFERYVKFKKQWEEGNEQQKAHAAAYNAALRQKYGIPRDEYSYSDLVRYLHTGGIAGIMNFASASRLRPDEIAAVLQRSEIVLQPKQLASLIEGVGGGQTVINNYHAPLYEHSGDNVFEDAVDVDAYMDETARLVKTLRAQGERGS